MGIRSGDRLFFLITLTLALAGFAIFSSAALGLLARENASVSHEILDQVLSGLVLGIIAFFICRSISLTLVKKYAVWIYGATILFTAIVFVPGIGLHANGATRWINLGVTTIQPAEFLKAGVIVMLAWWLTQHAKQLKDFKKGLLPFLGIVGLPAILLLLQPNTSTTMLVGVTGAAMYFAAGAPWRDFAIFAAIAVVALGGLLIVRPYALQRVKTFIDPSANALGSGYQIQQSLIAVGSGGLLGRGFGQSVEKFNYLPEPDGDSVFAVYAEETGFVGAIILLGLFVLLAARGIAIAADSRDMFGGLLALGFSVLIAIQAFVNMSAILGIIPLTGLPLPFVSHGGTALLVTLAACGIILNVAQHKRSA
jgi:cell division protein FtsW